MKKGIYLIASGLLLGMLMSCEKYFEDHIASPNNPTQVTPDLLLANIEVATFASYGGQLARQTEMLVQHIAGTVEGSQTVEIMNYNITELTNENEWGVIYTGAMVNAQIIIDDFGAESPHYAGIAKVIMAMNLGLATDLWGDVPYSDALRGEEGNLTPTYDSQQALFDESNPNSIFSLLDDAIADLSAADAGAFVPGTEDFIYGGNTDLWIKAAYSLKARYYNRLSEVDPAGSAANAEAALANAIEASSENAEMKFGTGGNSLNQWFAYENDRPRYIRMGEFFMDMLQANNDPRLPFYADPDDDGNFSGTPKDDVSRTGTSGIGPYLSTADAPIPLMSYSEMKFIEAEVKLRQNAPSEAADAYNEAVKASVEYVTGAPIDPAFEAAFASETGGTITQEKIMTQKYVALFGQIEAYNDWRRTGFPNISPATAAQIPTIPVRFVIPQNERLYNPNVVTAPLTQPVWWDQ